MTLILCCLLISSSVEASCMLCRRSRLYCLSKAKILAQQCSHHFRILCSLLLRTRLTCRKPPPPFSLCHLFLTQGSPFRRLFLLVLNLFSRPSFHFLLFFCASRFLPGDIRSCTLAKYLLHDSRLERVSILPSFFVPNAPPPSHPQPTAIPSGPPFFLFVFDLRAVQILLDTLPGCSLGGRLGIFVRACLLHDALNHFFSNFIPHLSLSAVHLFLLFFFSASFLRDSSWQPSSTVTKQHLRQLQLIPFLYLLFSLSTTRTLLCAASTQSLPPPSSVNFFP